MRDKRLLCCSDLLMVNTVFVCMQVSGISGSVLETFFKRWDPQGTLQCNSHTSSSRHVYTVQTTGGDSTHTHTTHKLSVCLFHPFSFKSESLVVWLQTQASSASSAASQRSFSSVFLSPKNGTLRAQVVWHNKTHFEQQQNTNKKWMHDSFYIVIY